MIVSKQPELNVGMIGHVDHGKTTLTYALTGEWTARHSEEIRRGISIKIGYADAAFYGCNNYSGPDSYSTNEQSQLCGGESELKRVVSFVDSPGHETLMAVMLSGAAIMDGALLIIAANEKCPQPQTREHLKALEVLGVENIIVVQTKIDLVSEEDVKKNFHEIKKFLRGSVAEDSIVVPVSAYHEANIDFLIKTIVENIPPPIYHEERPLRMDVLRSFDINRPGTKIDDLKGGVIGGSIIEGIVKLGDEIEVRPGIKREERNKTRWESILTKVVSIKAGELELESARCGGLITLGTTLDPTLPKADGFAGQVAGYPGNLPDVLYTLTLNINLLENVVGLDSNIQVETIKTMEPLMLNVGSATTVGVVKSAREDMVDITLKMPVCAMKGQRVAISRRFGSRWRLIGYGIID